MPSKHNNKIDWSDVVKLSEQLLLQTDLISLAESIERYFRQELSCNILLWLSDSFTNPINFPVTHLNLHQNYSFLSDVMVRALNTKQIIFDFENISTEINIPKKITVPLLFDDHVLGVINFDRNNLPGFTKLEIEEIRSLCISITISLNRIKQEILYYREQKKNCLIHLTGDVANSFNPCLEVDDLIESIINQLKIKLGFEKVCLYFLQEAHSQIKIFTISKFGIEKSHINILTDEVENIPAFCVISSQESLVMNDTTTDSRFPTYKIDEEYKSVLLAPLINGDKLLGVLELYSAARYTFDQDSVDIYIRMCNSAALVINYSKILHNERIVRYITEGLQNEFGSVSINRSYESILDNVLIHLNKYLPSDISAIWLFDKENSDVENFKSIPVLHLNSLYKAEQASNDYVKNDNTDMIQLKDQLLTYEETPNELLSIYPWILEILNSKMPSVRNRDSMKEPLGQLFGLSDYSAIGIPLNIKDQTLGLILSISYQSNKYDNASQVIASIYADHVSQMIENARLFSMAHDQVWRTTLLLQIAKEIHAATSLDELVENLPELMAKLTGINGCTLYLWDQSVNGFFPQSSFGFELEQRERLNSWDVYFGITTFFDLIISTRLPVIITLENLTDEIRSLIFPKIDFKSNMLVLFPMISKNRLIGTILINFVSNDYLIHNIDQRMGDHFGLIQDLSDFAAVKIDSFQITKTLEEEAYISIALLQVAQAIVSLNELDEILGSIVRITPILVGIKRCIIYLWDKVNCFFYPSQNYGFSRNDIQKESAILPDEFPFINKVFESNRVNYHPLDENDTPAFWYKLKPSNIHIVEGVFLDNSEEPAIELDSIYLKENAKLLIGFPLSAKGEVLGVMLIEEENPVKGYHSQYIRGKRLEIINGITQQAALAIMNERLQAEAIYSERMERDIQLAKDIQMTFLPEHLPKISGWTIDIRWQPARHVAGDFYDIIVLDESRLGFVIADVADKGMPAALFMTLIRTLIRAAAKEFISPAKVLRQVNKLFVPDAKNGMFVTVCYAVIDLQTGNITYANAGHNPPIIRSIYQSELIELKRTSIALGIFEDIEVGEADIQLNSGEWILFYTDGVTEAFSENGEMFGINRLKDLLLAKNYSMPEELLDSIETSVNDFLKGLELSDDLTIAAFFNKLP